MADLTPEGLRARAWQEGCPDDCGHDKILLGKLVEASNALRGALARRTT